MSCLFIKRKEVSERLKISEPGVLRYVAEKRLTPYIYFQDRTMYGIKAWRIAGIVSVTGLFLPSVNALIEFLHRGIAD